MTSMPLSSPNSAKQTPGHLAVNSAAPAAVHLGVQPIIHVTETCVWLGSLGCLAAAVSLLEPVDKDGPATIETPPPAIKIHVPSDQAANSWWEAPSA